MLEKVIIGLELMGQGMVGIFIVILIIMLGVLIMNRFTK